MTRRWMKLRKRLVGVMLPMLRAVSPRAAARVLAGLGQVEHVLSPGSRVRHDEAVRRWSHHFGCSWNISAVGRALAGNEVRWQARDTILDGLSDARFAALFDVQGREHVEAAHGEGRGVILLASHYGSHMVPLHWMLRQGYPTRVYMEKPHHISRFLAKHFAGEGPLGQSRLFISRKFNSSESAGSILRAVRVLKSGLVLCVAGDVRWSGPNTAPAHFLGEAHAFTATWVVLASMTGAPVVPVFCRMLPGGTYALEFRAPLRIPADTLARRDVARHVQAYLESVEGQLQLDPSNGNEYATWPVAPSRIPTTGAV